MFRTSLTILCVCVLSSCSQPEPPARKEATTNPQSEPVAPAPPASTSPTPEIDEDLLAYLALPAPTPEETADFSALSSRRMTGAKAVNDAYKAAMKETDDRDLIAHASFQRSRLFLAVGCVFLHSPAPAGGSEPEAKKHRVKMVETSHLMFAGADEALRNSVEADGARSPEAAQILVLMRSAKSPEAICQATEELWKPKALAPSKSL